MSEPLQVLKSFTPFEMISPYSSNGWKTKNNMKWVIIIQGPFPDVLAQSDRSSNTPSKKLTLLPQWVVQEACKKGRIISQGKVLCFTDSSQGTSMTLQK